MTVQTSGYLLVCADNKLLKQDLSDIFGDPDILFEDSDETVILTGMRSFQVNENLNSNDVILMQNIFEMVWSC